MAAKVPSQRAGVEAGARGVPVVGSVLGGKFRVVRQLGQGGMGVVFEAEHAISGKRLAVKWMQPDVASRPQAVERFVREACACARVRHPNVVDVYDVVHEGDSVFLVMELLEGEPLSAVLQRGGMPAHELVALLIEAMRGVAAAHRHGVIHRDVKPDNIFLCHEADRSARIPKVLDFGISKLNGSEGLALTQTGAMLGTPMYMSSEQLRGVRDIDARTDVYAFGVILYEALTGRTPYEAETFAGLIFKIANTEPTPPKALRADIPSKLERVILSAIAKDRDKRFATLEAMIHALEPFAELAQFRAQMTCDNAALPCVVSPSLQLAPTETPTGSIENLATGLPAPAIEASLSTSPLRRRHEHVWWFMGSAALAALLAAATFYGSRSPAVAPHKLPEIKLEAAQPKAASNAVSGNASAVEPALERAAAAPQLALSPSTPPAGPAEPAHGQSAANIEPTQLELRAGGRASSERARQHTGLVHKPKPMPLIKPSFVAGSTPSRSTVGAKTAAPATVVEAVEQPSNLRAGRPHSEEF